MRFAAVVLAAGQGRRFGGSKLLAALEGRPLLQHVLDAVASSGPVVTVVVLGDDADDAERVIAWDGQLRVVNADPTRGLSSSLELGIGTGPGSRPRPRRSTRSWSRSAISRAPRPPSSPRSLRRSRTGPSWCRAHAVTALATRCCCFATRGRSCRWLSGDRGLGAFIDAHPDLVLEVPSRARTRTSTRPPTWPRS